MDYTMKEIQEVFIRAERLRMSALCLDMEINHIKDMSTMYRKTMLMDTAKSWGNGFWPFVELLKIKGCTSEEDFYAEAHCLLQQCVDMCKTKNEKLDKLLKEMDDANPSQADPTEH
jgi:hypothetical protein